jgi:magnesium-transporting ATPase (P-type)
VAWRCLFLGLLTAAAGLSAYFFVYLAAGWRPGLPLAAAGPLYERATTMCYGGIICAAAGNALALRTDLASIFRLGLRHNPLLAAGLATVPLILLCLSYVPFLQQVFHTAPLLRQDLLFLLLVAPLPLLADEARKAWQRWSRSRKKAGQGRGGGAGRAREGPGVRES